MKLFSCFYRKYSRISRKSQSFLQKICMIDSQNTHCIAKAKEPIPFFYGNIIGVHRFFIAQQRRYQHNQGAFRQVEIGHQSIQYFKLIARIDENIRVTICCNQFSIVFRGNCFQRPAGGRSNGNYPSPLTGRNVPNPTCSVTNAVSTPFSRNACSISLVKCKPAVGAAAEPNSRE